jgi:hypothetical protein
MIEFVEYTAEHRREYARWLASLSKAEVIAYAERKMMPRDYMLDQWKQARKMQRTSPTVPPPAG